jgi:phage terminase large subunit
MARLCDEPGGPSLIGYGGTRGQAKSHAVFAQAVLDDMTRFDGLKWLYLRKIQKKAAESMDDLRRKVLRFTPNTYKNSTLTLPNKSFMIMGGFRGEADIDGYLGLEYDGLVIEDATTLTKTKHDAILGALRTSRTDWRPRAYESANPGGVGHQWFRQLYYDPWVRGTEGGTRFIHTLMGDNAFINPEYEAYLNGLTGWLRRAWRDGDFEISAGQYFSTWDERIHVIRPLEFVPRDWVFIGAMDYGFIHWNVVLLLAIDGDGHVFVLDEHAERRWLVEQHYDAIVQMLARNQLTLDRLDTFVCGPDVFAQRGYEETIAAKYERLGISLAAANTDRISGAAEVLARLGNAEAGIKPRLFIYDRCRRLIACLPTLLHDPHRPEDVLKVDCDDDTGEGGDDSYDALRYGLMRGGGQKLTVGASPLAGYRG